MKIKLLILSFLLMGSLSTMAQRPGGGRPGGGGARPGGGGIRPPAGGQMRPGGQQRPMGGIQNQRPPQNERPSMDRLRAMKVGMITNEISLTSQQARGFWPVYNEFDSERRKLNASLRRQMQKSERGKLSEAEELKLQDDVFELRQKELQLTKDYRPEFLKVISAGQYSNLLAAERAFNQMLLKELRGRRNNN